ncbi:MAG TPA: hypothetical protein VG204_19280 [Terriglobia bacterium]|nr:hypothetical protein [Terriglobia bacterium]
MRWMLALETEKDPIAICRLMNIFRRKGVSILKMDLESGASSFSLSALVETRDSDVPHLFHFLRRTEGVYEVICYQHEPSNGVNGDGACGATKLDSSRIIHTSRAMGAQDRTIGARSNAPVETLTVS